MGKYTRLGSYLKTQKDAPVTLTFTEIEEILGESLPPSARRYVPFWGSSNSVDRELRLIGWRARAQLDEARVRFEIAAASPKAHAPMRVETRSQAQANEAQLVKKLAWYVRKSDGYFTGPSKFFHEETMRRRRAEPLSALVGDRDFLASVYATLTAWGMHRMGPGTTRLIEFDDFASGIQTNSVPLIRLESLRLDSLEPNKTDEVAGTVWKVIQGIGASHASTQLVAGSKTVHHLLPDLVPPMDREYTLRFLFGRTSIHDPHRDFVEAFRFFRRIAHDHQTELQAMVDRIGFNSSLPKVIDNALIGFGLESKKTGQARALR